VKSTVYCPIFAAIAVVINIFSEDLIKETANKYSFHDNKKTKAPVAASPGEINGKIIFTILFNLDAPSIHAASSNSIGIEVNIVSIIQIVKGKFNMPFKIIKGIKVL